MEQRTFVCRNCGSSCPIVVTLDGTRVLKVEGDREAPLYQGYTCPKGRAIPIEHHNPRRLLQSLKRLPDGSRVPISSEQLVEEIAQRVGRIIDAHGPQAVAAFLGNGVAAQPAASGMMLSFLAAIGSRMMFSPGTIDQPGLLLGKALHGSWQGGRMHPQQWDTLLVVGGNPVVSKQYLPQNPAWQLKQLEQGGMRMIVIDPRRTETARRAAVHLQAIPGEDPTVLAGLIHLIFALDGIDEDFVAENAEGAAALREAVAAFTPDYVAARAGLDVTDLVAAARILVESRGGDTAPGVGTSMATRGTLTSYLALCIQTLRGMWSREGDPVSRPKVLTPRREWRAQPTPPFQPWFGEPLTVRGLMNTVAGMPTAALPDLMMSDGPDRIRAFFLHGGAYYAWPDTNKTVKALGELDLFVMHDVEMSGTAAHADYVIATYDQLETPAMSALNESVGDLHPGYDWNEPYAFYRPALLPPPEGAELMESWQIYYRVAQKLGLPLSYIVYGGAGASEPVPFDMANEPRADDIYEMICNGSAVPLSEVKKYPHGAIFDECREVVGPREAGCTARLQLADPTMLGELAAIRAEDPVARRGTDGDYPFQLVCRRIMASTNSAPRIEGIVRTGYNPLWMNPADMAELDVRDGDEVEIRSRHGAIPGFVEADTELRRGVVAMTHGFGPKPNTNYDPRRDGSNINLLLSWTDDADRFHGMPRMSAVPVSVKAKVPA